MKVYDPELGATNDQNSSGALPEPAETLFEAPAVDPVMVVPQVAVPCDCGTPDVCVGAFVGAGVTVPGQLINRR